MKIRLKNQSNNTLTYLADCKILNGLHFTISQKSIKQNFKTFEILELNKNIIISMRGYEIILTLTQFKERYQLLTDTYLSIDELFSISKNIISNELKDLIEQCYLKLKINNFFNKNFH